MAQTLVDAQKALGWDAELITVTDSNLWRKPLRNPGITFASIIDNFLVRNGTVATPISCVRADQSALGHLVPYLCSRKNVHLHWVEGVLTRGEIEVLLEHGVNIVWTLHDMAPFTGGCHHAIACAGYQNDCGSCPQVRKAFAKKIESNFSRKEQFNNANQSIHFVAPSEWMASRAEHSALISSRDVKVIPNPIDKSFYGTKRVSVKGNRPLRFVMVASDLSDPNKNIQQIIDLFAQPDFDKFPLTLIGANADRLVSASKKLNLITPKSVENIAELLQEQDVLISNSLAESFSLVIAEAQAVGLYVMARAGTAGSELALRSRHGTAYSNIDELGQTILKFQTEIKNGLLTINEVREFSTRFQVEHILNEYKILYVK